LDDDIERSLSSDRRNALEAFTASCFRRLPAFSNYKETDVRTGVRRLALWVATQSSTQLNDEGVFAASSIKSAEDAGFLTWSPMPRINIRTMLSNYGDALRSSAAASR
jgi:hypothetical protein